MDNFQRLGLAGSVATIIIFGGFLIGTFFLDKETMDQIMKVGLVVVLVVFLPTLLHSLWKDRKGMLAALKEENARLFPRELTRRQAFFAYLLILAVVLLIAVVALVAMVKAETYYSTTATFVVSCALLYLCNRAVDYVGRITR